MDAWRAFCAWAMNEPQKTKAVKRAMPVNQFRLRGTHRQLLTIRVLNPEQYRKLHSLLKMSGETEATQSR
jgi:hypothetical protein